MESFWRKEVESSTPSFESKSGTSASSTSNLSRATTTVDDGAGDPKGSLGLNLLHSPSESNVDFIFVHGLGGGSRKTWSKTGSLSHYWPQEWLPKDPVFRNTRIHSFGYNSDYARGGDNCLNIHHFGKSLLGEISTSPHLAHSNTAIVLIGHSMGGLVIKKAYILAAQHDLYASLRRRFHSMYFLATPHRGSDSAKILKNLLHFAFSSRAYISELQKGSSVIQTINDDFRQHSTGIDLWSFYETEHFDMGIFSRIIVDPDSAVLGFREEKQMPMNADHRSICKFETPNDRNYLILRNALAQTVDNVIEQARKSRKESNEVNMKSLNEYLSIAALSLNHEDDLTAVKDARVAGTCDWFFRKTSYAQWRDFASASRILWINGMPACGKSVLAGYIVDQLQANQPDIPCSYFFFKHGDKVRSRLSSCLRSLAFQMASSDVHIRETLLDLLNDRRLSEDNDCALWRKLFTSAIFSAQRSQHYWIIDGLDECSNFISFFESMLASIGSSVPLRILITSRDTMELEKLFKGLGIESWQSERILPSDTLADIQCIAEMKSLSWVVRDDQHRHTLIKKVISKAQGSFLWTVLVLKELSSSYSEGAMSQALEDVPTEMKALFRRILDQMSKILRGKDLIQAVLAWTTCAIRPLTVKELEGALRLDTQDNFANLEDSVTALCGQLVSVDKLGKVRMVHATAQEFLLSEGLKSEFAISPTEANTRITRICLRYLIGEELRPPRSTRRGPVRNSADKRAAFSTYACHSFSYHLIKADPGNMEILALIKSFLESNILSWIEVMAQTGSLQPLIRIAKHLRMYLNAVSIRRSPLGREIQIIRAWTTDLVRIAAKFAGALAPSPSAIYFLIPPFCPAESTIHDTAIRSRNFSIVGFSETHWDDRLSCIDFRQGQTSAVCYGDEFLAVGSPGGAIVLYHNASCQKYKTLDHGETVKFLQFKDKTELLASCGMKTVKVWNTRDNTTLYAFAAPARPMNLVFDKDVLMVASYRNYFVSWDLASNGTELVDRPWRDSDEDTTSLSGRQPCAISISVDHSMLAVAYSGRPIALWDLEEDAYYGSCGKKMLDGETSTHLVTALVLNPNKAIELLVASYLDGELVLIDPFNDQEIEKIHVNCHTLAASPDGRLLGGGAGGGVIEIFEFDTLRLLYRVRSSDFFIRQIAFSKDNLHFADIRGSQCNLWEPAALLRCSVSDDGSEITAGSFVEAVTSDTPVKISALKLYSKGGVVFCGKDDGSVCTYDLRTGKQQTTLYRHKTPVRVLDWAPQNSVVISADISNRILARTLVKTARDGWTTSKELFEARLEHGTAIVQILSDPTGDSLLLSTRDSDHLWSAEGEQRKERRLEGARRARKWLQYAQSPAHLLCIDGTSAQICTWSDWSEVSRISLAVDLTGMHLKSAIHRLSKGGYRLLLEVSKWDGSAETQGLYLFDATSLRIAGDGKQSLLEPTTLDVGVGSLSLSKGKELPMPAAEALFGPQLQVLSRRVAHIIGFSDAGGLVFLDKQSWVCSMDIDNPSSYLRHFFVPFDWFAGRANITCGVGRDVVLARNEDTVIAKGGLDFGERSELGDSFYHST